MHQQSIPLKLIISGILGVVSGAVVGLDASFAAPTVELTTEHSSLRLDLNGFNIEDAWQVYEEDQIFSEAWFVNLGWDPDQGEKTLAEFELLSFENPSPSTFSAFLSGFDNQLGLDLSMVLEDSDPASQQVSRRDRVTLTNNSQQSQWVTLFSYTDFDLGGTFDNDTTLISDDFTVNQTDPTGLLATLSTPQRATAIALASYPALLTELYDETRTNFKTTTSPLENTDSTVVFQFDNILAPGESVVFEVFKSVQRTAQSRAVPEPMSVLALGSATGVGLLSLRRR